MIFNKKYLIAVFTLLLLIAPVSAESNWLSFQGSVDHQAFSDENADFVSNIWFSNVESSVLSSPAISDNFIYLISEEGILKVFNMENGDLSWQLDINSSTLSSPVIKDDQLFVGNNDGLIAVNLTSHEISWKFETTKPVNSTAFINNDTIYVGCDNGHLYGLDIDNGDKVLDVELGGKIQSSPIIVNDTIFVGSTNNEFYSLTMNGDENWIYTTGDQITSSPAYADGRIAFGSQDSFIYVLNSTTGSLLWSEDLGNSVKASPTMDIYDNNLFIGSDGGNITCFDLRDGTEKWSFNTGSPVESTAAIKDNQIVVGSNNGNIYVLNKYTGIPDFTYNPGTILFNSPISSSPVIYGDNVLFADESGYLYSFNIEKNEAPTPIFFYYSFAVLIIVLAICVVAIKKYRRK